MVMTIIEDGTRVTRFGDIFTLGDKVDENALSTRNHQEGYRIEFFRNFYERRLKQRSVNSEESSAVCVDCDKI
ncbi:hypothetical protein TNCV_694821 [Trichonephila clavipes]|nr:hypothetical protein TNCV_694821 [Trichonephila clavipes]